MTLYELDHNIREALDNAFVDAETGEVSEYFDPSVLEALTSERSTKLENIGLAIKNFTAEQEAIEAEIKRLQTRSERLRKRTEFLKGYVSRSMTENGEKSFSTAKVEMRIRTSYSVNITDETKIPREFLAEKIEYRPDKKAIKQAIEDGRDITGAEILEKKGVTIK